MIVRICFGKHSSGLMIGSRIIEAVEKTDFSHAWIEIENTVFEAVFPKTRKIKKNLHTYQVVHFFEFYLPDDDKSDALRFIYSMLDKEYSFMQLVTIFIGNLSKRFNRLISKENINGKAHLICTEVCARFLNRFYAVDFKESFDSVGLVDLFSKCKDLEQKHGVL